MRRSSIGKGNVTMGAVKPIELIAGAREVEAVEEILEKIRNPRLCNPPRHRRQGQSLGCIAECAYGPASPTLAGWACSWHGCPGTVLWRAAPVRLHERPEHETAHRRRRGGLSFGGSPGSPLVRGRPHRDVRARPRCVVRQLRLALLHRIRQRSNQHGRVGGWWSVTGRSPPGRCRNRLEHASR